MDEHQPSAVDFDTLKQLLGLLGFTVICGYPTCCLIFSARRWKGFSRYEKGLFSVGVGSGLMVFAWMLITLVGLNAEYSSLVAGNEVVLTTALLCVVAMVEVFLMAILDFARRLVRRRRTK